MEHFKSEFDIKVHEYFEHGFGGSANNNNYNNITHIQFDNLSIFPQNNIQIKTF